MAVLPEEPASVSDEPAPGEHDADVGARRKSRTTYAATWVLEHAQDAVSIAVGAVLVLLSLALLISGVVDFVKALTGNSVLSAANQLLDRVLLVLIIVEVVHTVVLSLRARTLVPQPFIVVGLVAGIRKILIILSSSARVPTTELAVLIAMVAVFLVGLIAVGTFGDGISRSRVADEGASS